MKKTFLFIALLAGTVSFSQAQQRPQRTPEEMAKRSTDMLEKQLTLSADQKTKIYAIELSQFKTMDSLRTAAAGSDNRREMMTKMRSMRDENTKKISDLLNEDQKKAYQKMQEDMHNRMRNGQGRPAGQEQPQGGNEQ